MKKTFIIAPIVVLFIIAVLVFLLFNQSKVVDPSKVFNNNMSFGNLIAKSTVRDLQASTGDNKKLDSKSNLNLNILPGWEIEQIESKSDIQRIYNLKKDEYKLEIQFTDSNKNLSGGVVDSKEFNTDYYTDIDGRNLLIPIVENNAEYGPGNFVYIANIQELTLNNDGSYHLRFSNIQILNDNLEVSVRILLPFGQRSFDSNYLRDIYSMVKSIKWE